jgi:hypothetical protein
MSFWLEDYSRLLATLAHAKRNVCTVAAFLRAPSSAAAVMRHDVDRRPGQAVRMAQLENDVGVQATYYFRCDANGRFPADACRRIAALGHEIGYHFEDLSRCRGDRPRALEDFSRHLIALREIAPCATVSMHGSPLSSWNNAMLLDGVDLSRWQLLGDATHGLQPHRPLYFTDAGGRWNNSAVNLRDRVGEMPGSIDPLHAETLLQLLEMPRPVYFNVHPERWSASVVQFALSVALDQAARLIKAVRPRPPG